MADQPSTETKRINWEESFSFTKLFKTFRMGIHPNKLVLALAGIILMGLWGWILDGIWPSSSQPVGNEINAYWQVDNLGTWKDQVRKDRLSRMQSIYAELGRETEDLADDLEDDANDEIGKVQDKVADLYEDEAEQAEDEPEQLARIGQKYNRLYSDLQKMKTRGVFSSFMIYEVNAMRQMIDAAASFNLMGGFDMVIRSKDKVDASNLISKLTNAIVATDSPLGAEQTLMKVQNGPDGFGVIPSLILMAKGEQWLVTKHPFFYALFALGTLAIWAFIGGAICRIAALNFARDERISPKEAMDFAKQKFVGFFAAPLVPIGMVIGIGIFLFIGGLIGAIPVIGELFAGLFMFLALIGGFLITMAFILLAFGSPLFWPTIAVEGSDAFDAVSRSFSYIFTKPWRAILYGAILLVYGAISYLFLRFVVFMIIKFTRFFVEAGMSLAGDRPGTGMLDASKLDAMWPHPTFNNLMTTTPTFGLHGLEGAGAFLIKIWVALLVLSLCAYLASFFLSGSTIVYFLLRKKVDATDIEEVYQEEDEDAEPIAGEDKPVAEPAAEASKPEESPEEEKKAKPKKKEDKEDDKDE